MELRGVIDFSLGNFLCLRGFAPLGELAEHSRPDASYQRDEDPVHSEELTSFLNNGKYTFFPELVLGVSLKELGLSEDAIKELRNNVWGRNGFSRKTFEKVAVSVFSKIIKKPTDKKPQGYLTGVFSGFKFDKVQNEAPPIFRIDGNHRLQAVENCDQKVKEYRAPYCLMLFQDDEECCQFGRVVFHNINFKALPIPPENNFKLILSDEKAFPNDELDQNPSLGHSFVLARETLKSFDPEFFPNMSNAINGHQNTFFVTLYKCLIKNNIQVTKSVLGDRAEVKFSSTTAFADIKCLFPIMEQCLMSACSCHNKWQSIAIIGTLIFYKFQNESKYRSFVLWLSKNDISRVENLRMTELIEIYDNIYSYRPKKIFLARWYPDASKGRRMNIAKARYEQIKRVADKNNLELVDLEHEVGGSFNIRKAIDTNIPESDIFIADLTGVRPNVMVEIGMALVVHRIESGRIIFLFHDEKCSEEVPFDLSGYEYVYISDTYEIEKEIGSRVENILRKISIGEL